METANVKASVVKKLLNRIAGNPIINKELKGRMRGRQGFIIIAAYLGAISFFIALIYLLFTVDGSLSDSDPSFLQTMGKIIFSTVVLLELLMLGFIGPALTSGAISSERERKTIDLLRASLLSARSIVLGKLGSASAFLLLLVFTAIPIQSLAFFLGGVGAAEIIISTLMLVVTAVFFCSLGLFFSSMAQRTLIATVLSYSSILISLLAFVFFLFSIDILSIGNYGGVTPTPFDNFMTAAAWALLSTNPFFAAIMSEVLLVESQAIYTTSNIFFANSPLTLPLPWIIYLVFYVLLTGILVSLSIYFVSRPDR
jgi:ABC-type transport system involved in multi-copper enzyme maturation permease subunit